MEEKIKESENIIVFEENHQLENVFEFDDSYTQSDADFGDKFRDRWFRTYN